MSKHHLYDESPAIKHTDEGHTKVEKMPKKEEGDGPKENGVAEEGFPILARHSHERDHMHVKHQHEHAMHDHHHPHEDKHEMHGRHEHEEEEMHTRHEKEAGAKGGRETGEPIEKIEKGAK